MLSLADGILRVKELVEVGDNGTSALGSQTLDEGKESGILLQEVMDKGGVVLDISDSRGR